MAVARRYIQVGTGGMGNNWCRKAMPPNMADGMVEPVAAVDINPEALVNAREGLGLPAEKCYTDLERAFDDNEVDFCTVVVPPAAHELVVDAAVRHGVNILSEKPIADTIEASCRIAQKVEAAGLKMGVTMSHRFRQDITTLRRLVWSRQFGELDYLVCRYLYDGREYGRWGEFRYHIDHPLMVEAAVHHLDLLVDLASMGSGAKCSTIYAQIWNPRWSTFAGDSQALVTMTLDNGKHASYEGANVNAVALNNWKNEYIRAECEGATLIMEDAALDALPHFDDRDRRGDRHPVELIDQPKWSNAWLIEKFIHWLDGGEPMETNVRDNLQSMALVFAAIESNRTSQPVDVQAFLKRHLANVL